MQLVCGGDWDALCLDWGEGSGGGQLVRVRPGHWGKQGQENILVCR